MILHDDPLCTLYLGDCVEVMRELPAESVDAVVTDPPYGLEFMGKEWDRNHEHLPWAREAFRVAKPGAHLLAFGGTRTYHRLASAIEDAGWEIRDCLVWAYASGFPKSLDVSKAIDKKDGRLGWKSPNAGKYGGDGHGTGGRPGNVQRTADFEVELESEEARKWDGWGTALKPAWEPIVMARKPLRGTVAANVLAFGTGALNIDATRIATPETLRNRGPNGAEAWRAMEGRDDVPDRPSFDQNPAGRWPANLILTDPIFDGDTPGVVGGGASESGAFPGEGYERKANTIGLGLSSTSGAKRTLSDSGTYSRFFLIPKSSRSDREPVLRGQLEEVNPGVLHGSQDGSLNKRTHGMPPAARENAHPTVKPLDLMRHLVRLVTPPGGTVLDPFLGSGTTAIAANSEGFRCIGIEKEREYLDITLARMTHQPLGMSL